MRITFYDAGYGMLGVQYNMACLAMAGHEVDLFFDNSMSQDHLAQDFTVTGPFSLLPQHVCDGILQHDPEMVCFSIPTYNYRFSVGIIRLLKQRCPGLLIATGGVHPTLLPRVMLRHPEIDFAVVGEGEQAFPRLVDDIDRYGVDEVKAMPREAHPGCWNVHEGVVVDRGMAPTVKNLDELPYPEKRLHYRANPALRPIYSMLASRGCVFTCTFCNSASLNEKYRKEGNSKFYRMRSVDNVIEELRWAKQQYQPRYVQFLDDIFGVKRSWLIEFSEKYKREIGLPFEIQTNPKIHNDESMKLLADCGCVHLEFGFQSANAEIRSEMLSRKESNEQVQNLIRTARGRGMLMELDLIMNLPGETETEIQEAIRFVEDVSPEIVNVSFLQYFPKTKIINTALQKGILQKEDLKRIEEGEMVSSMRLIRHGSLHKRYHILPLQMYLASRLPRSVSRALNRVIGLPGFRDCFVWFGSITLYAIRVWIGITDQRDFYHRRQIPRTIYAARSVLLQRLGMRREAPRVLINAPAEGAVPNRLATNSAEQD